MAKKLYKSRTNSKIDGVCGGVAEYFNIDPTIVRIAWLLFAFSGAGIIAYVVCMLIIPRAPKAADEYPSNEN
ncbi:MAG: PspC domain-containing protein [Defluviitaleaceae bacterium]|nr:PspC domain-containing protein [Defluviitaleaceae bacterium]